MKLRILSVWMTLSILLAGCGGEGNGAPAVGLAGPSPTGFIVPFSKANSKGVLFLGRPGVPESVGVRVEARYLDGTTAAAAQTDRGGGFHLAGVPPESRILAYVDRATLSLEVRGEPTRWLWISGVTTMISRYMQSHPGVSLEDATRRVKAYLGIPASVDPGSGLGESWRSPFAWSAFVQAAGNTPLDTFIDQQVARVDTGATASFRTPHPYSILRDALHGGLIAARVITLVAKGAVTVLQDGEVAAKFGAAVLANVAADLISDLITAPVDWGLQQTSIFQGTTALLQALSLQVDEVSEQTSELAGQVQTDATSSDLLIVYSAINPIFSSLNSLLGISSVPNGPVTGFLNVLNNFQASSSPQPPGSNAVLAAYIGQLSTAYYTSPTLDDNLQTLNSYIVPPPGQVNVMFLWAAYLQSIMGITSPNPANLFLDLRDNTHVLEPLQQYYDSYAGYQTLALMLATEAAHCDYYTLTPPSASFAPANYLAANTQTEIANAQTTASTLAIGQQLAPPPSIGGTDSPIDYVLVDLNQKIMWYTGTNYATFSDINGDVATTSIGPWVQCWSVATLTQLENLRTQALAAAGGTSSNDVTIGLQNMGFTGLPATGTPILVPYVDDMYDQLESGNLNSVNYYNLTTGSTANENQSTGSTFSYLIVRECPGYTLANSQLGGEDASTLRAVAYPTSLSYTPTPGQPNSVYGLYSYTTLEGFQFNVSTRIPSVNWSTNNPADLTVANGANAGAVTYHTATPASTDTVIASLITSATGNALSATTTKAIQVSIPLSALGSTQPGPSAPALTSIVVSPNNYQFTATNPLFKTDTRGSLTFPVFATGFYSDGTVQDLSRATGIVWSTSGLSSTSPTPPTLTFSDTNQLTVNNVAGTGSSTFQLTATFDKISGSATVGTSFP